MHSHIGALFLYLYLIAVGVITAIWWLVVRPAVARRAHQRVAGLLDVFDAGTAKIGGSKLVRGYYGQPNIVGLFHGRPASISTQNGLASNIQFCVSTQSRMPFEVRPKRPSRFGEIRKGLKAQLQSLALPLYITLIVLDVDHRISFWRVVAAVFLFFLTLRFLISRYAKWMGYNETLPEDSRWEVSLPGSAPLLYATYSPARFRTLIDRPEIQEPVAHLFGTCQIDLLRSAALGRLRQDFPGWDFTLETDCFYSRKLLETDVVRKALTEISILCANIEQIRKPNDLLDAAASRPV